MKVLVIGSGGREHAVCAALKKSTRITELLCAPGNGGISQIAECVPIKATDIEGIVSFAKEHSVDYVVVTPDDPLALGMVDALEEAGIRAFGPRKDAAVIEASKVFSKSLMKKYGIPTAQWESFDNMDSALAYLRSVGAPIVVKADGLALGKGVVVAETLEEAEEAVRSMMLDKKFGESGSRVVIEERLTGPELTVLCFTDGKTIVQMPSSRDHKRAYDNDMGPNTGGMGAFCPVADYTPELAERCVREIFVPTINAMTAEGRKFKGVIYFGLMLTPNGPKVIEYNARFGDPETQPVLSLLETDLLDVFEAVTDERLGDIKIKWKNASACCVVIASGGYPVSYKSGYEIFGLDEAGKTATVFHAGTKELNGKFYTSGGRVLGVTAVADTIGEAVSEAYKAAGMITFENMHMRKDIAKSALTVK